MTRVRQKRGIKGSLKWIQGIAENPDHFVNQGIRANLRIPAEQRVDWRSPRADDDFAEYRDESWLAILGLSHLAQDLKLFWPRGGPQWDAVGRVGDGRVLLVEAKAHVSEMNSTCAASSQSREQIDRALESAKVFYGANGDSDWGRGFYQYANRLAHVRFLRAHDIDAHLVGVYFLGDMAMRGPREIGQWAKAIDDCHDHLGLPHDKSWPFIHHVFVRITGPR